ncbi:Pentapeptide repeat-containing protein [Goodfellowiella coeruleoviolacea]|uniref:Pentapeptide repeat-containing protein n=1 Tax=Goodfellowiella coeruleoviolacea TaxID=334858 RepID=A0AAE3GIT3_9PSEU|nr:Pentapeptide repeat-containing protein [Goodfellowiella coeruleoviolacea]
MAASAVLVIAGGSGVGWWLWRQADGLSEPIRTQEQAQAVRVGLATAGGTGAALALLLAVRRQRSTEHDLWLKEQAAADARHDATERRITELYTKAVEQLGSDKAPVRLGGLYALERLAQANEEHRQTIVDVICAYLRMPQPCAEELSDTEVQDEQHAAAGTADDRRIGEERAQLRAEERQVRQAAQRILINHLRPDRRTNFGEPTNTNFWAGINLDLSGSTLHDWHFDQCEVSSADFRGTTFHGLASFHSTVFRGFAGFVGATFHRTARFSSATFRRSAWFIEAAFHETAEFEEAIFHDSCWFDEAAFHQFAGFAKTTFHSTAWFDATFHDTIRFDGARVRLDQDITSDWPAGWQVREPTSASEGRIDGSEGVWGFLVPPADA